MICILFFISTVCPTLYMSLMIIQVKYLLCFLFFLIFFFSFLYLFSFILLYFFILFISFLFYFILFYLHHWFPKWAPWTPWCHWSIAMGGWQFLLIINLTKFNNVYGGLWNLFVWMGFEKLESHIFQDQWTFQWTKSVESLFKLQMIIWKESEFISIFT